MKKQGLILVVVITVFFAAGIAYSADYSDSGTTGVQILEIVPDARSIGMGGAYCAVSNDAGAVFYNPAGLALVNHTEIPFAVNNLFENVRHEYLGVVYNLADIKIANLKSPGTVALAWSAIDSGEILGRDASGNPIGNFKAKNRVIMMSYGRIIYESMITGSIFAGITAKSYKEEMYDNRSEGEAFDGGILWKCPKQHIYVGAAYRNFGKDAKYVSEGFDLPRSMTVGASGRMLDEMVIAAVDLTKPDHADFNVKLGVEYWHMNMLALRLGYNSGIKQANGITAGFGLSLKELDIHFFYAREITLDYAFVYYNDLEDMHRLSLNLKLGAD